MVRIKNFAGIFLALLALSAIASDITSNKGRSPNADEIMKAINDFEGIMNKDIPSMDDFYTLYPESDGNELEMVAEANYCQKVVNLEPDTVACNEAIRKLKESVKPAPSIFLNNLKNILTENQKCALKIYVRPQIEYCKDNRGLVHVKGLAFIGKSRYRHLVFDFPCTIEYMKLDRIGISEIDGKRINTYPFTITKPFTKPK